MLVRLVYASRAVDGIDDRFADSILNQSRTHNAEHGITGVLCVYPAGQLFLQALEGAREQVNTLYTNIVRDPRHRDVMLLDYTEIAERRFANWNMGRVDLNRVNRGVLLRFSDRAMLNPYTMSGGAAVALLEELSVTAAVVSRSESG